MVFSSFKQICSKFFLYNILSKSQQINKTIFYRNGPIRKPKAFTFGGRRGGCIRGADFTIKANAGLHKNLSQINAISESSEFSGLKTTRIGNGSKHILFKIESQ